MKSTPGTTAMSAANSTVIGALLAGLLAFTVACSGGSPADSSSPGDSSTPVESHASTPAETPSAAAPPEYCAELYEFLVGVNTFDNTGYQNSPMVEPMSVDELIAEADRLAQWALDLQAAVPPDVADALSVLSVALVDISAGFTDGLENWEAMLPIRDDEVEAARAVVGDAATIGDCAV